MQLSGSVTVEVPVDRLAERVADIIVARLHAAAQEATSSPRGKEVSGGFPVGDGEHYERGEPS